MKMVTRRGSRWLRFLAVATFAGIGLAAVGRSPSTGGEPRRLKLRVAVAPINFQDVEAQFDAFNLPIEFRSAISERLTQKLLETGRFTVVDRQSLQAVIQEQELRNAATGRTDKAKVVPAQALVTSRITNFAVNRRGVGVGVNVSGVGRVGGTATEGSVTMVVRLINVDTTEVLHRAEAQGKSQAGSVNLQGNGNLSFLDLNAFDNSPLGRATNTALEKSVKELVSKLDTVLWTARVADFDETTKDLVVNAGEQSGVRIGDVFEVVRRGKVITDPETGEVIRVRLERIGKIKISAVEAKSSNALVLDGSGFQTGDVIREIR